MDPSISKSRSTLANDVRLGRDTTQSRQQLAAAKLAQYIAETVAAAPPLTDDQRERLSLLLRGVA